MAGTAKTHGLPIRLLPRKGHQLGLIAFFGFFFGFATNDASFLPFRPETLIAYEVGVKHQAVNGALRVAASAF